MMMTKDETYNGWANRETWAFMLHVNNDEGLTNETIEVAREVMDDATDWELGNSIVGHWADVIEDWTENIGEPLPEGLAMFQREVGSWWRIDCREVGEAVRELLD